MSDDLSGFSRERLEAIWARVLPNAAPPAAALPTGITTELIDRELSLARDYCGLARSANAKAAARTLFELSNEQLSNAKSAAGIFFLDTGEFHFPVRPRLNERLADGQPGFRPGLRQAWKEERALAALYISLADASPPDSEPGYLTLAHTHSQHAVMLRSLLEDSIG